MPRITCAALLLWLVLPTPAYSDGKAISIPGTAYAGDQYFYTQETEPIIVNFVSGSKGSLRVETAVKEPVIARGAISEAYVFSAPPYDRSYAGRIPPEIWTSRLGLMLTVPRGEPYSVSVARLSAQKHVNAEQAGRELRHSNVTVHVYPSLPGGATVDPPRTGTSQDMGPRLGETADGLEIYGFNANGPLAFLDPGNPAVRKIICLLNVERSRPEHYCSYEIVLADNLLAEASFVDFRLHGGRDFARQRIAEVRAKLCEFFACDSAFAPP
jgi:hypothetical protein